MYSYFKSIFCTSALVAYIISFSRTDGYLSEFSSASPASCGNIKIVNAESAFFISEFLSSDGRRQASYSERSKGMKYFGNPVHSPFDSSPSSYGRKDGGAYHQRYMKDKRQSFKTNQYNKKLSNMLPKLESEYGFPTYEPPTRKPNEFSKFMGKKFTGSYKNDKRMFPEPPTRVTTKIPRKVKKDMVRGLSVKVEGKKKLNSSHANHKDTPSKFPSMIRHIIEKNKLANKPAVELIKVGPNLPGKSPAVPMNSIPSGINVERSLDDRPMPMGNGRPMRPVGYGRQMEPSGNGNALAPWMDVLGSLGPDKIQKLKSLLGNMDNGRSEQGPDYDRQRGRQQGYGEGDSRMGGGSRGDVYGLYEDGPRQRDEEQHRPQAYNLDKYNGQGEGGADFRHRRRYGVHSHERVNAQSTESGELAGRPFEPRESEMASPKPADGSNVDSTDPGPPINHKNRDMDVAYSDYGEIPEAVVPNDKRVSRAKRSASPDDMYRSDPAARRGDHFDDDQVKSCTWKFRKGTDCKRMVVKMHYWVDGVRDCNQEYLLISGSGNSNRQADRLCGGQEDLTPYTVDGDEVSITHFKQTAASKGVTKFKGTVQCEL